MSAHSANRKIWLMRLAKLVVVLLVVWFVRSTILAAMADLEKHGHEILAVHPGWLALAGVCYLAGTLPMGLFWFRILRALGQRPRLFETLRAYTIGHLGKYVPGKALVVVLRAGLLKSARVDATVAAVSVFLETLTMMAVGGFLAGSILLVLHPGQWQYVLLSFALMAASGVPTLPPVFRLLVRKLPGRISAAAAGAPLSAITPRLMLGGWLGVAVGWLLIGTSLYATLRAVGTEIPDPLGQLPVYTASVALAMVAGFLSLIPGGLFVRDLILAQILVIATPVGEAKALIAAVYLRLVWLLSELIISGILYVAGRDRESIPAAETCGPSES